MRPFPAVSIVLTLLSAWGCSDGSTPKAGASSARGACPASAPAAGASCSVDSSVVCEYGDDVRVPCRARATCAGGSWSVTAAGCDHMAQAGENGCPVAHPTAGSACGTDGLVCQMLGGDLCACAKCLGGPCAADPKWGCAPPPTTEGCPETAPLLGTYCDAEGLSCAYGVPCVTMIAAGRRCETGTWVDDPVACPE